MLIKCSDEIQKIEKSLGINKKTRESGARTRTDLRATLKQAAREYSIHLSTRLKEYEHIYINARHDYGSSPTLTQKTEPTTTSPLSRSASRSRQS